ncbi:septation initiation protein [Pantoea vagans]|uniref:phage polarity suppression protein n=1 Tax=Pantoea vagans TaxID=470934 RepID=UPI0023AE6C84|nr:septation initiation protein [Pantoea vagans]MDE8559050.1 septation initiation protein [Pantoea vagans]MDE8579055.1 septation initiation protein [Pantoea vagans]
MTDITSDISNALPVVTQAALVKVNIAKASWLDARNRHEAAVAQGDIIRQRRRETEATATAQNDEWRRLFRENGGVMTPEMKKLRAEVALNRESLEEFDALLALHAQENELLPWETSDRALAYISAHSDLVNLRAMQLWQMFMDAHGQQLIQTLSLLKITLGRQASAGIGEVHSVNDPDTALKNFITRNITDPALVRDALPEDDVFQHAGAFPARGACDDYRNSPSPAARHKILARREMVQKEQAQ